MSAYKLPLGAVRDNYERDTYIFDADGNQIFTCSDEETATSLVLAVNHFEEAVGLLKEARSKIVKITGYECECNNGYPNNPDNPCCIQCRIATKLEEAQDG